MTPPWSSPDEAAIPPRIPSAKAKKATPPGSAGDGGAKSAATRARIPDGAATVLAQHGSAGTRLADVAREAQVQAPAIYYYFAFARSDLIEGRSSSSASGGCASTEAQLETASDLSPLDRIDVAIELHLQHELKEKDYARGRRAQRAADARGDPSSLRGGDRGVRGALWGDLFKSAQPRATYATTSTPASPVCSPSVHSTGAASGGPRAAPPSPRWSARPRAWSAAPSAPAETQQSQSPEARPYPSRRRGFSCSSVSNLY